MMSEFLQGLLTGIVVTMVAVSLGIWLLKQ
jgi:hypothetical protein